MSISKDEIDSFIRGDKSALKILYDAVAGRTYSVIYKMVRDQGLAQDLTHDTFVHVYEKRKQFVPGGSLEAWTMKAGIRLTLNTLKRERRRQHWERTFAQDMALDSVLESDEESVLVNLVATLPIEYRAPILLKDIEGNDYESISQILEIPIGTVRSRLNRGRKMLRKKYEEVQHGKAII
jgi:RNA polymerase sigma-70 factor (ECF subfamily)